MCEKIFVPAQADAFRRRNGQVSASRFFLWVCLADLVAVLWHAGQLVLSGEQAGGLRGCRWLCGPAGLGARNCTGECADGPAGGCLCGCIWLCCLGMPCHQELDQGMRRWASWWLALQQPAGGRSQMADGEGREGRWWPVGGLARTKLAALRATRLHPCVVTLGLASNTPRRRPLNADRAPAVSRYPLNSFSHRPHIKSPRIEKGYIEPIFGPHMPSGTPWDSVMASVGPRGAGGARRPPFSSPVAEPNRTQIFGLVHIASPGRPIKYEV